jgi:hypothetical protein
MNARALLTVLLVHAGCVTTTGGALVTFEAAAAGPADAVDGQPLVFPTAAGYDVTLTRAQLHVGALYLNRSQPLPGAQATACVLPGIYVGEVTSGLDVDALSPTPQPFPVPGQGTAGPALTGEVWLTGAADVNVIDDSTVIAEVAGTATKDGVDYPFVGTMTIGGNRLLPPASPAFPGVNPPCKERIVSPIPVELTLTEGGSLLVRVDPRAWFINLDFAGLTQVAAEPPLYQIQDSAVTPADKVFYDEVRARLGVFTFEWRN